MNIFFTVECIVSWNSPPQVKTKDSEKHEATVLFLSRNGIYTVKCTKLCAGVTGAFRLFEV